MGKPLKISEEAAVQMPMKTVASLIAMVALPADSEQFMMIEDLYKTTDKLNKHIESMALNKVNIEFLTKQMDKVLTDIEKLKDASREMKYTNGNGGHQ
jgi:division protein CdvB (Snf7/Vps24/ESCRT-III family)